MLEIQLERKAQEEKTQEKRTQQEMTHVSLNTEKVHRETADIVVEAQTTTRCVQEEREHTHREHGDEVETLKARCEEKLATAHVRENSLREFIQESQEHQNGKIKKYENAKEDLQMVRSRAVRCEGNLHSRHCETQAGTIFADNAASERQAGAASTVLVRIPAEARMQQQFAERTSGPAGKTAWTQAEARLRQRGAKTTLGPAEKKKKKKKRTHCSENEGFVQ
jgi:hypothetical protein